MGQYNIVKWKELSRNDAKIVLEFAKRFVRFVEEVTI
jgi:HEPN domain-containing protein